MAVTMTRTGGEAVSLAQRCKIANNIRGLDLFVSLHSNAAAGSGWSSASGWSEMCIRDSQNVPQPGGDRCPKGNGVLRQGTQLSDDVPDDHQRP